MAYSETLQLVQGDTLPQVRITLRDQNTAAAGQTLDPEDRTTWAAINLTGCTVRMKIREIGSTVLKDTITGSVTDAVNGVCVFVFDTDTLDTAGQFEAEIEMTTALGGVQTVLELIRLQVREQF